MPSEHSIGRRAPVRALVDLLEQAEAGQLDHLTCPVCGQQAVSVWFKQWERTYFKCNACDFDSLVINTRRPAHYTAERDLSLSKSEAVLTSGIPANILSPETEHGPED
jgi:hypothetical protein